MVDALKEELDKFEISAPDVNLDVGYVLVVVVVVG